MWQVVFACIKILSAVWVGKILFGIFQFFCRKEFTINPFQTFCFFRKREFVLSHAIIQFGILPKNCTLISHNFHLTRDYFEKQLIKLTNLQTCQLKKIALLTVLFQHLLVNERLGFLVTKSCFDKVYTYFCIYEKQGNEWYIFFMYQFCITTVNSKNIIIKQSFMPPKAVLNFCM